MMYVHVPTHVPHVLADFRTFRKGGVIFFDFIFIFNLPIGAHAEVSGSVYLFRIGPVSLEKQARHCFYNSWLRQPYQGTHEKYLEPFIQSELPRTRGGVGKCANGVNKTP